MADGHVGLYDAAAAAQEAARAPLVSGVLEVCSNEVLSLAMSDEAAARLLDIAILCGNSQAAANLAKICPVRPLRRWNADDFWLLDELPVLSAALLAGADFQELHLFLNGAEVPLLRFLALGFDSQNQLELSSFTSKAQWPSHDMELGRWFLSSEVREDGRYCQVSTEIVRNGLRSGWDLRYIWSQIEDAEVSLLDLAILSGNSDCATALATAGAELSSVGWIQQALRGESLALSFGFRRLALGSASACRSAAVAAARASSVACWKREGEKGVAVYQVLTNKFHPRDVPMALVHHILGLSMERPKISEQLNLKDDEFNLWLSSGRTF